MSRSVTVPWLHPRSWMMRALPGILRAQAQAVPAQRPAFANGKRTERSRSKSTLLLSHLRAQHRGGRLFALAPRVHPHFDEKGRRTHQEERIEGRVDALVEAQQHLYHSHGCGHSDL